MQYFCFTTGDESPLVYLNAQQRAAALWDWSQKIVQFNETIWVRSRRLGLFRHSANSSTNQQEIQGKLLSHLLCFRSLLCKSRNSDSS